MEEPVPLRQRRRRQRLRIGNARGVVVALEAHIAAERNRGELPARAAAVGEAGKLAAEADREGGDADSAPAGDEEMPHLVHEHDRRQHDQRRNDVAREDARDVWSKKSIIRSPRLPSGRRGCGASGRRGRSGAPTESSASASSIEAGSRQQSLGFGRRQGNFDNLRDCGKGDPVAEKGLDRDLVRGVQHGRGAAALLQRLAWRGRAPESARCPARSNVSCPTAARSSVATGSRARSGQCRQ